MTIVKTGMTSGGNPETLTVDRIYDSEYNLRQLKERGIESHIARKKRSIKAGQS